MVAIGCGWVVWLYLQDGHVPKGRADVFLKVGKCVGFWVSEIHMASKGRSALLVILFCLI